MSPITAGRAIRLEDRASLEAGLGDASDAPSEQCFANLFLFRARHRYRLCTEPVPHVRGITYDGQVHALPLGAIDIDGAHALLADGVDCLFPLAEDVARALAADSRFALNSVSADDDYLFDGPAMAALQGAKVRRAQAKRFAASAAPVWLPWKAELAQDALAVLEGWLADVGRSPERTDIAECREAIAHAAEIGLEGGLVRAGDGAPLAFLLASRRRDGERIVHFAKGRRAAEGVYPWMFAHYAAISGAPRLNFEQDLGNPGLAQSKQAYRPVAMRRKWRLSRRGPAGTSEV